MDYDGPSQPQPGVGPIPTANDRPWERPGLAGAVNEAIQGKSLDPRVSNQERIRRENRLSMADTEGPGQMSLRERVYAACQRGQGEQRRFERALRTAHLMERNPEVAELVELLREF